MQSKGDILVVDDDAPIAQFIIEALQDEGYTARGAANASEALAALAAAIPDLILLDLLMPGMSGSELLAYLRTHGHAEVPVVIMTADTRAAQLLTAQGVSRCLLKPFTLDALLDCVARAIRTNGNSQHSSAA